MPHLPHRCRSFLVPIIFPVWVENHPISWTTPVAPAGRVVDVTMPLASPVHVRFGVAPVTAAAWLVGLRSGVSPILDQEPIHRNRCPRGASLGRPGAACGPTLSSLPLVSFFTPGMLLLYNQSRCTISHGIGDFRMQFSRNVNCRLEAHYAA